MRFPVITAAQKIAAKSELEANTANFQVGENHQIVREKKPLLFLRAEVLLGVKNVILRFWLKFPF